MTEAYNMDCMEYMHTLPDKAFDLAVCDPPYFSGPERRRHYGRSISTTRIRRPEYPIGTEWHIPDDEWYQEVCRVSKEQIIWGINYFHFTGVPPGRIIWDKCNGSSTFSDCEIASASMISSSRLFRYMWNGMMQGRSITEGEIQRADKRMNEKRIHPTQKPIDLYKWIFTRFAPRGGRILDTHLGSGSSRIAAAELGFDFVGTELDPKYFAEQEKRFREYKAQGVLFTPEELIGIQDRLEGQDEDGMHLHLL